LRFLVTTSRSGGSPSKLDGVTPRPLAQRIALGLMHATQVATPFHQPGWVYEEKVDGYRMAAMKAGDGTRLISRNGIQHTKRFPELVQALDSISAEAFLLDGEVAVYDRALISRFEWLRGRPKDEPATLPVYMVFDVLELGGKDLRREPLRKRRKVLEELVAGARMILPARRLSDNGLAAWAQVVHRGYEGMVGKDPESPYVPGRTLKWLKVKVKDYRKEERGFYRE
jgi:bifunctional non-homologous end joining protein LigD